MNHRFMVLLLTILTCFALTVNAASLNRQQKSITYGIINTTTDNYTITIGVPLSLTPTDQYGEYCCFI